MADPPVSIREKRRRDNQGRDLGLPLFEDEEVLSEGELPRPPRQRRGATPQPSPPAAAPAPARVRRQERQPERSNLLPAPVQAARVLDQPSVTAGAGPRGFQRAQPRANRAFEQEQELAINAIGRVLPDFVPAGIVPADNPDLFLDDLAVGLAQRVEQDIDGLLDDIVRQGRTPEMEYLLKNVLRVSEEDLEEFFPVREAAAEVFPSRTFEDVQNLAETDWLRFVETVRFGPPTAAKRNMLLGMGVDGDTVDAILRMQRNVVHIDGVTTAALIDNHTGDAFDSAGNYIGSYDMVTQEFSKLPEESRLKDYSDAWRFAGQHLIHSAKSFALRQLPEFIFPDVDPDSRRGRILGETWVNWVNERNRNTRDFYRHIYGDADRKWEEWVRDRPELRPRRKWAEGPIQNPDILRDPGYWAYEFATTFPFLLAVMGSTVGTTALTRNPVLGLSVGVAVATAAESKNVYDALLEAGASEEDANQLTIPIAALMGGVEVIGDMPYLKKVLPRVFAKYKKDITKEIAEQSIKTVTKQGLKVGTLITATEVVEEIAQNAVLAAGQRIFDESQPIFENVPDTAIRTAIATAPLAVFGGGLSMRRAAPSEVRGLTDEELNAKGWRRDPATGHVYENLELPKAVKVRPAPRDSTLQQDIAAAEGPSVQEVVESATGERQVTRKRTVEELKEAGVVERPQGQSVEAIEGAIEETLRDSKLLRAVEKKSEAVFNDLDEFSFQEIEFLESEINKDYADIRLPDVVAMVREGLGVNETRLTSQRARLVERQSLEAEAEAAAIERGIGRIGLEETVTVRIDPQVAAQRAVVDAIAGQPVPSRTAAEIDAVGGGLTPLEAQQQRLAGDWDRYLLTNDRVKGDGYGQGTPFEVTEPPGDTVVVYRAVPEGVDEILPGQYVSASRKYVEDHLEAHRRGEIENPSLIAGGKIISATIPKADLGVSSSNELVWVPKSLPEVTPAELDITEIGAAGIQAQAAAAGLPPPNLPPGVTTHLGSADTPEGALYDMVNSIIPNENAGRAATRLWTGKRNSTSIEIKEWMDEGDEILLKAGLSPNRETMLPVFLALHGESNRPSGVLGEVYDRAKEFMAQETSDMLAFDSGFSQVVMAHPDYFPRGWIQTDQKGTRSGGIGATPGFLKPRINAEFSEILATGREPTSWNPLSMVALRRLDGIQYREGIILVERLKRHGMAMNVRDAPRDPTTGRLDGWRVPEAGPAFGGKPYVRADGKAEMTPRVAVPTRVADIIESVMGKTVEARVAGVDVFKAVYVFGAATKLIKLLWSPFQHIDIGSRNLFASLTPYGISQGVPLRLPSLAARITVGLVSGSARKKITKRALSNKPLYDDFNISLRMVADKGWELGNDEMLIRRDVAEGIEKSIKEEPGWNRSARVVRRLKAVNEFYVSGLFEVMYRESQAFALEHLIIPQLRRMHSRWTPEQIAGSAAEEVNKKYSSLPVWQSAIQQPAMRAAARTFFFSMNEIESWLRQFFSTFVGQNSALWRQYQMGTVITLALIANIINKLSDDEWLPLDRYSPVTFGSPYSSMPGGIDYNDKFMSPRLPWNGRNGQPIYLDIVGQADTAYRLILNPKEGIASRQNVFPRAIVNQAQGKDFWGREFTSAPDRARQIIQDLFFPIGVGHLAEAARLRWPAVAAVIPEAEGRIGQTGALIQALGFNVRAEKTGDLLERHSQERFNKPYDELGPKERRDLEKDKALQTEMGLRGSVAVQRNYPGAAGFAELDRLDQERLTRGELIVAEYVTDLKGLDRPERFELAQAFRKNVGDLKKEIADRKKQVDLDYELFDKTEELPDDPNKAALVLYYKTFDDATRPSGVLDWEKQEQLERDLRKTWTPGQAAWVDENTGLMEWGPLMTAYITQSRQLGESGYWDEHERDRRVFRFNNPDVEEILKGQFYNLKPIEGEAEAISLKWRDVYQHLAQSGETFRGMTEEQLDTLALPVPADEWATMDLGKKREAHVEADKELIYLENHGFFEDDKARDAWNLKFNEELVEQFVDRATLARRFSPNAPETKLYMLRHPDLLAKMIKTGEWTDDHSDESIVSLELRVKWRPMEAAYALVDGEDTKARLAFRMGEGLTGAALAERLQWNDDRRRIEALGWNINQPEAIIETHVAYGNLVDEFGASSAEVMLFRQDDTTGYEKMRTSAGENEPEFVKPVDQTQVKSWRIDVKWRVEDAELAAIKGTDAKADAAREAYKATRDEYRKDWRRRDGYEKGVPESFIETHVALYEWPESGFRRDRMLQANAGPDGYYEKVWRNPEVLDNNAVDFSKIPDVRYDEIHEKWASQFEEYDDILDIPRIKAMADQAEHDAEVRWLRDILFRNNPGFHKARYRAEAYGKFVPEKFIDTYAEHHALLYQGKPLGWEVTWAEDRFMQKNKSYYQYAVANLKQDPIDFTRIPSWNFERQFNVTFIRLRHPDGSADLVARAAYRDEDRGFDLEGANAGLWKVRPGRRTGRKGRMSVVQP